MRWQDAYSPGDEVEVWAGALNPSRGEAPRMSDPGFRCEVVERTLLGLRVQPTTRAFPAFVIKQSNWVRKIRS